MDWRNLVATRCGGKDFDTPGGGYAFSEVIAEEQQLEKANVPGRPETALLKLSIADPTWKMPIGAMMGAIKYYLKCPDATRYTDNAGIRPENGTDLGDTHEEIVNALKRLFPELPSRFDHDWVQYSPGAIKRALAEFIPTAFFEKERKDLLVFPTPGYPVIKSPMNNREIEVQEVPMFLTRNGWRIPLEKVRVGEGRQLYLYFNNPHNPTGSCYTQEELTELVNWAIANGVILIVDEAYILVGYLGFTPSILTIPNWEKCSIVLQSVSKGWNATGLRFGWMIGEPEVVIPVLRKVTNVKDSGLFGSTIAAGLTCLRNLEYPQKTQVSYRLLHEILAQGLAEAGFGGGMPDAGLCQFTKAPRRANGKKFASVEECVRWFRNVLRVSLMHYEVEGKWYLRWAVTLKPVPRCGLRTEKAVLAEAARRLQGVTFSF